MVRSDFEETPKKSTSPLGPKSPVKSDDYSEEFDWLLLLGNLGFYSILLLGFYINIKKFGLA